MTTTTTHDEFDYVAPADHHDTIVSQYPGFQWFNGDQKLAGRKTEQNNPQAVGGFFGKTDNFPEPLPEKPFIAGEVSFENGESETGYLATSLRVAVIMARKDWRVIREGKLIHVAPDYFVLEDGTKAKQRQQLLCGSPDVCRKNGELYPFLLTFNGVAASGVNNYQDGVLTRLDKHVVNRLKALTQKELPRYCFWITITGKKTVDGKPYFELVGPEGKQSPIVKPDAPDLVKPLELDALRKLYVGNDLAKLFASWRDAANAERWQDVRLPLAQRQALAASDQPAQLAARNPAAINGEVIDAPQKLSHQRRVPGTDIPLASQMQIAKIYATGRSHAGLNKEDVDALCVERYHYPPSEIATNQASELIQSLMKMTPAAPDQDSF